MLNNSLENSLRNAKKFIKIDEFENASEIYKSILIKYPKNKRVFDLLKSLKKNQFEVKLKKIDLHISKNNLLEAEKEGDELLLSHPNEIELLKIIGMIKGHLKKYDQAKNIFLTLIKIEVPSYMTFANLGNIFYLEKNYSEAAKHFKKSIELNPNFAVPYNGLALLFTVNEQYELALENFKISLKMDPRSKDTLSNLGNCYKEMNKYELALEYYYKALEIDKNFPEAYNNIGIIMSFENKSLEAIVNFTKAIELTPNYVDALYNRGVSFHNTEQISDAILDFEKVISIDPNYGNAYLSLGNAFFQLKNYEKAIHNYLIGVELIPTQYEALNNLGVCYTNLKQYDESIKYFDRSINSKLDYSLAYNNKGNALNILCRFEEAFDCLDLALNLNKKNPEISLNIGNLMTIQSKYVDATKFYENAIKLNPNYADAYFNLSLIKLLCCDFENGLRFFEWRLRPDRKDPIYNSYIEKTWDGKVSLKDKKIVVLSEQGLGDTIQFSRFVKLLSLKTKDIIFKVQDTLVDIISDFDKNIKVVGNSKNIKDFDYQIPLMSLPFAFNINYKTIPAEKKYLFAKDNLIDKWKAKIGSKGFKVGISWKGSNSDADRFRSFSVNEFEILSSIEGIRFISLQKNDGLQELDSNLKINIEDYSNEIDNGNQAFLDTAAIIENLDLVITCDTSIGHLSGALNCPTWIVLASSHDWRWFLNNENSAWYPSVTLFRQKTLGDWTFPFLSIKEKLLNNIKI